MALSVALAPGLLAPVIGLGVLPLALTGALGWVFLDFQPGARDADLALDCHCLDLDGPRISTSTSDFAVFRNPVLKGL
jgi:hypothetical protein